MSGAAYFIAEEASVSSGKIVVLLRYHSGLMNRLAVLDGYLACILGPVGGVHSFTCLGVVGRLALFNHSSAPEMAGRGSLLLTSHPRHGWLAVFSVVCGEVGFV